MEELNVCVFCFVFFCCCRSSSVLFLVICFDIPQALLKTCSRKLVFADPDWPLLHDFITQMTSVQGRKVVESRVLQLLPGPGHDVAPDDLIQGLQSLEATKLFLL